MTLTRRCTRTWPLATAVTSSPTRRWPSAISRSGDSYISPYLPIPPYISPYLPISPYISTYLPTSLYISTHLALRLLPRFGRALFRRAATLLEAGKPTDAVAAFEALYRVDRDWPRLADWLVRDYPLP